MSGMVLSAMDGPFAEVSGMTCGWSVPSAGSCR